MTDQMPDFAADEATIPPDEIEDDEIVADDETRAKPDQPEDNGQ